MQIQDEGHKKLIDLCELLEYLQVIDKDKNDNPITLGNPEFSTAFSMKLAESNEDFEEIFNRKLGNDSSIKNISSYITRRKELANNMIRNYTESQDYNKLDYHLLDVADSYLMFLDSKIPTQQIEVIQQTKPDNKNLLLNGKDLNLSERFKIANEVLNIDKTIRKLNIKDLEKYKVLSYILNCSEDNARHLMNGKYNSKDRDLKDYFKELNLNK
jgi:hypothetical protein